VIVIVVVIMIVGRAFGFGLGQHFLEFAFYAFAVDRDTAILGCSWGNAVHKVSGAGLICCKGRLNQRKVRCATVFVGGCAAMTSKAHSNEKSKRMKRQAFL